MVNARLAGQWLAAHHEVPDLVMCSSARRTKETWEVMSASWDEAISLEISDDLYQTRADMLLDRIRMIPEHLHHAVVIGHEPTMSHLAWALSGPQSNQADLNRLRRKFPTSAICILQGPERWSEWNLDQARLVAFEVRRST